jgi:hypothetical protein
VVKNLSFLLIILLICGCSSSKKIIVSKPSGENFVVTGAVVNPSAFEKGGNLLLGSFKAGTGAAADDQTDQLSLMMMNGIRDTLPVGNTHFIIPTDDQKDPDCFLEGHIEDYGHKGHFSHLSVSGEIWLRETGEKIFFFQISAMIDLKTQDPNTVAYQIGVAIAHFIGSQHSG